MSKFTSVHAQINNVIKRSINFKLGQLFFRGQLNQTQSTNVVSQ